MRPALVLNDFNHGGAERLVRDLTVGMGQRNEVDPIVIVANDQGELRSDFVSAGVEYVSLDVKISMATVPKACRRLSKVINDVDADVLHSHLAFSDLTSRLACMRLSLPHVSTYHNVRDKRTGLKNVVERLTWRLSDVIICVSAGVKESYSDRDRMRVIYNGIDVEGFRTSVEEADTTTIVNETSTDDFNLINIARYVDVKRQEDLIEAVSIMEAKDVHLYIIGSGPLQEKLERVAKELDVSDQVTVTGYVEKIEPYYAIADAFVSASSHEGLPTTHVEAMAAELPIISTDIPGVREVVKEGESGYLCPVNEPKELADAIYSIYMNEYKHMGKRGAERAKMVFSIDSIVRDHVALYRDVI